MITVSDDYKTAIYGDIRETKGKVVFEILDVDSSGDATGTVTSEASISRKTQLYDRIRDMSGKYATFEPNYFKLDGSFSLPPYISESTYQVGWWSDVLSQSDGTFSTPQVITTQFTINHSSIGLTIIFDPMTGEYAEDFEIVIYDSTNAVIYTDTVTGNTLTNYILEQNLNNYRKIIITITKWAVGYRRARITEIDFGIVETYTDNELVDVNVLEEVSLISDTLSSNEIKFTIDNSDKRFNILNPQGVYSYLQRKQLVTSYIGVVLAGDLTEYVPMGVYYLNEWIANNDMATATFTARDCLDLLDQVSYSGATYVSKSITYIIEDILNVAGISSYTIDSSLDSIIVSGTLPESKCREAIQTACIAGQSVIYSDRYGVLQVKQLVAGVTVDNVDFDNVYTPPKITTDKQINTVNVKYGGLTYSSIDPDKPSNEPTLEITIDNPLISTAGHAQDVAEWLLGELLVRYLYEVDFRGNPALECCDVVICEDDFTENRTMRITKQEFKYAGYLESKLSGKGSGT